MSLIEQIKAAATMTAEKVEVPAWGVTVEVRPMSVRGRSEVYRDAVDDGETAIEKLYPALVISSVFDPETGQPVFTQDDTGWLIDQPAAPVEMLAMKILEISGLTAKAVEAGKAVS